MASSAKAHGPHLAHPSSNHFTLWSRSQRRSTIAPRAKVFRHEWKRGGRCEGATEFEALPYILSVSLNREKPRAKGQGPNVEPIFSSPCNHFDISNANRRLFSSVSALVTSFGEEEKFPARNFLEPSLRKEERKGSGRVARVGIALFLARHVTLRRSLGAAGHWSKGR
ncbi:hypothetical protein KM043_001449 [Ampulex compressa]|nr:hypothetical protein KM043_001449 [Ampulex compressa]